MVSMPLHQHTAEKRKAESADGGAEKIEKKLDKLGKEGVE